VLPLSFMAATGTQAQVVTRPLPLELAPVAVQMLWPMRQDADPAHRWLRQQVERAASASAID
jgi:DNA-binding transcriptional LysR family regulator